MLCAPQRGVRLEAEKQRKRQASSAQKSKSSKWRKGPTDRFPAGGPADGTTAVDGAINDDNEDEEFYSDLVLTYNTVRTSFGHAKYPGGCIRQADRKRLLKMSIARGEHQRRRDEFTSRGLATDNSIPDS